MAKCGVKKGTKISKEHREKIRKSMKGKRNAFKGGRYMTPKGYVIINVGLNQNVYEHRFVIEKAIGRKIRKGEVVHHINGNKSDNRVKNLMLLSSSENIKEHHKVAKEALKKLRGW